MTGSRQEVFEFQGHGSRKVRVDFGGGYLSSNGRGVFVRGVALKTGTLGRLTGCFADLRFAPLVEHSVEELVPQRIGALALGYEDLNDHDRLRRDPLLALMAGKKGVLGGIGWRARIGAGRWRPIPRSIVWSSERSEETGDTKKIIADAGKIEALLIEE